MELSPCNLPCCRELAHMEPPVLWPSCPTSRGEKPSDPGTTPSMWPLPCPRLQPPPPLAFLLVSNELEIISYSSVSQMRWQRRRCRAKLICFARSCLEMTDRVLINPGQIQSSGHWFIWRWREIPIPGLQRSMPHPSRTRKSLHVRIFLCIFLILFYLFNLMTLICPEYILVSLFRML